MTTKERQLCTRLLKRYMLYKHIDKMNTEQPSQGCAKAVSLIQAVRSTSVNDIDNNGYVHILVQCNCFTFLLTYTCLQKNSTSLGYSMWELRSHKSTAGHRRYIIKSPVYTSHLSKQLFSSQLTSDGLQRLYTSELRHWKQTALLWSSPNTSRAIPQKQ